MRRRKGRINRENAAGPFLTTVARRGAAQQLSSTGGICKLKLSEMGEEEREEGIRN